MAEDHGAPETEQFPRASTRGHTETESRQKSKRRTVRSLTVQNKMRDVLRWVPAGAA